MPDLNKTYLYRMTHIENIPHILELPKACKFNTRCTKAFDKCFEIEPELIEIESNRFVRCHLYENEN